MRRLVTLLVLLTVVAGCSDDRDLSAGTDAALDVFDQLVSVAEIEFGAPDRLDREVAFGLCGGVSGPSEERQVELVAQWQLESTDDARIDVVMAAAESLLGTRIDIETLERRVLEVGARPQIYATGSSFRNALVTAPGVGFAVIELSIDVHGPCWKGPFPDLN